MPTAISHAVVGLAAASAASVKPMPVHFWVLSALCPVLPDLDVIAFKFGIPYAHFLGHRGFSHSLFFAFVVGMLVTTLFSRDDGAFSLKWCLLCLYFSVLTASHGILDAMTNGGFGVALLSPYDRTRYFLPWTPIDVAPLSLRAFFTHRGMKVMWGEILLIWIPSAIVFIFGRLLHGGKV